MKKKFTRRDFLKVASIGTASALAMACGLVTPTGEEEEAVVTNKTSTKTEVLVLGAGISGLAAARTLMGDDWDVIVLEARDRVGGRIWTDTTLGVPLDMGASWIHGESGNPITELAKQFGVKTTPTDDENAIVFKADGSEMSDVEWAKLETLFEEVYAEVEAMQEDTDDDMPLQTAFDTALAEFDLSADQLRQLNYYAYLATALEYGADPKDLSLWEWDQDEEFGGNEVIFPGGYNQITNGLAQGLDIRLGIEVKAIRYGNDGVEVETSAGVFMAEKAVVTFPLGVLKQGVIKFEPPLPSSKRDAISRLGMGLLSKVYLKFPEAFWDEDVETISYIGDRLGEWCDWLSFAPFTGEPILMAFHGGDKGVALEKLSDAEISAEAMKALRAMFGDDIPEPVGMLVSRWSRDPYSFGAYSYIPPFASGEDHEALFEPVDGVLYFAGEATSRQYPSTVHGAYLSGVAAAEEII
ncbi:MAG: FAD-dependent oxidoreductase [Anaerolineales bacterium]|nr:FAD-dependent oxidoreductase [Anaerolineales bacterium]MCB9144029.1 FAD-dependent oxidoreductase [Anaerolineales bacterium]